MQAFVYGVFLQWKLDIRDKGIVLTYYVVPLVFFGFMGGIFTSIDPLAKQTIMQSMTVFGVTMGAFLGSPTPLVQLYGSEMKKAYQVGGIPLGIAVINNIISGFIHLFLMSLVIFFLAPIAFDASYPNHLGLYFMALAIFILACLLVGSILGLFVKNVNRLTMVSQFLFLPSMMLSGIMFPTSLLPNFLATIGKAFPATWGYINLCKASFSDLSLIPLFVIVFASLGIVVYKIKSLES